MNKISVLNCEGIVAHLEELQPHVGFLLEKRYIEENADWATLYRYEVPVLAGFTPDGREIEIPRPSPRASGVFLMRWLRKHYFEKLAESLGSDGS
ncbi:hypothetical protein T492DRAFT_1000576 [Pavlovales sp. CCMP2436]|nr:hypothetical protein T492DRAFT_1000576 [Pavlovales sp. CCMP2436]|mmetsp:Transcript_39724/g.98230  ORF Transcript_39724/g.98230 Transcript_39724/m.98230 type:complete len:95 (-) Transcript_39724:91-375(-)